ncbi:MAG: DNA polymerase IV [Candidatus Levybacteria bacterium]|nr:DNA polymerase IV [Candidatus Levybacteria bacterium]
MLGGVTSDKIILHIDFDSFFASVEQQYNPSLRGKPLGVTATNGRTCIIAASREAKNYGIKTGSRTFEAFKLCPKLQLVSADFVKYWEISKKFIQICNYYSPYIEVFSIDELFMNVTHSVHLFIDVQTMVDQIKETIKKEIGEYITVSVGISHNKLLAKLASGLKKPNGVMEITSHNIDTVYASAHLTDICGIGERIKRRLNMMGIFTLMPLRRVPLPYLTAEFGPAEAAFLHNVAFGIDDTPLSCYAQEPEVKSVGRNYCLPKNEHNRMIIFQNLYELCEEVAIKLRRLGKKAKTIGLYIGGSETIHGQRTFSYYFDTGKELFHACSVFWNQHFLENDTDYVRQMSIWASHLHDVQTVPDFLFDVGKRNDRLWKTVDAINEKFGDHTIRNGFLLYADKLTTVPNGYMADKYERMKLTQLFPDRQ